MTRCVMTCVTDRKYPLPEVATKEPATENSTIGRHSCLNYTEPPREFDNQAVSDNMVINTATHEHGCTEIRLLVGATLTGCRPKTIAKHSLRLTVRSRWAGHVGRTDADRLRRRAEAVKQRSHWKRGKTAVEEDNEWREKAADREKWKV
ncbi:hypothetical protein LSAT2_008451 [Lamellibrachia satsuma]|nr:hypothetical protein LSAT2_008451 [Lamellibrachia satsuma]